MLVPSCVFHFIGRGPTDGQWLVLLRKEGKTRGGSMVRVYCSRREGLGGPLLNAFMINVDELERKAGIVR